MVAAGTGWLSAGSSPWNHLGTPVQSPVRGATLTDS